MTTTAFDDQFTAEPEPVRQPYDTGSILRRNVADMEVALRTQTELKERAEAEVSQLQRWKEEQLWIWGDVDAYARKRTPLGKSVCETALDLMSRAEAAEAELAKLAQQSPIKYLYRVIDCFGHDVLRDDPKGATILETIPLYTATLPAPHKGATHCDDCGLTWLDDGLNPLRCPYCKDAVPTPVPATCNDDLRVELLEMLQWMIGQRGKAGHSHRVARIWDGDNGAKAGTPCDTCAMYDKARALLQSATTQPAVPAVPEELREFLRIALNSRPFITSETYGGRYTVLMRFEKLGEMQDCYSALISLLQSAGKVKAVKL